MARPLEATSDTDFVAAASKRLLEQKKVYPARDGSPIWNPSPQAGLPHDPYTPPALPYADKLQHLPPSISSPPPPSLQSTPWVLCIH